MTVLAEKYVSVAGSGAHDGSSAANAWTIAEATASVVAGDRVNCLAGTYIADDSSSSSIMDLDVNGTGANPIIWRAYTTTIDDFVYGDTPPVILDAGTNSLTNCILATTISGAADNTFDGFSFTNASSHGVHGGTSVDNMRFNGCSFTNNGGRGAQGDNNWSFWLCEFSGNTTNSVDSDTNQKLIMCKFHNENGPVTTTAGNPETISCLAFDCGNNPYFSNSEVGIFLGNTIDGDGGAASSGLRVSGTNIANSMIANNIFFDLNVGVLFNNANTETSYHRGFNYFSSCNTNYDNLSDANTDVDDGITDPFEDSAARDYRLVSGSNALGAGADAGNFA